MTPLTRTIISTRNEFVAAVRLAFDAAAQRGATEIVACDRDFADWPLGEPRLVETLTQWAGPRRRLVLLAHGFDEVARRHGRWTEWRRRWSHLVDCRQNDAIAATEMPTLLLVPGVRSVRLFDPVLARGVASSEADDERACQEVIDAVLQHSAPAFPATMLGL